ncbi:MAG: hypothetical protein QXD48_02890 [Candidatus Aenigmatarchaeota archaeon]
MKKDFFMMIVILFISSIVFAQENQIDPNLDISCQNLWWFDNDNLECGYKQFCGSYMYYGLQTFKTKEECNDALLNLKRCSDSDGDNPYVKGYVSYKGITYWDECSGNGLQVMEKYCYKVCNKIDETNEKCELLPGTKVYDCPNGCKDGACIKSEPICIEEGQSLGPAVPGNQNVCCPGLTVIQVVSPKTCEPIAGTYGYCTKCGDGICKYPENACNCPKDCDNAQCPIVIPMCPDDTEPMPKYKDKCIIGYDCIPKTCPITKECPDGSSVFCKFDKSGNCVCDQCPIKELPPGCTQQIDEKGFVHVICEKSCPSPSDLEYAKNKCKNYGGIIVIRHSNGCEFIDCVFKEKSESNINITFVDIPCPKEDELNRIEMKCREIGGNVYYFFKGECKFVECKVEEKRECKIISSSELRQTEIKCREEGLSVVFDFDDKGCRIIRCGSPADCLRDPPSKAIKKCNDDGGDLIVKRDTQGCINYINCIRRGDVRNTYVEEPERIPEPNELLGIAFKLEKLKIDLNKFAYQANQIADYYKSIGDSEEEKYRRVAHMFEAIKYKIDEIKEKLKSRLEGLSIDDLIEIKQDIKYIKDVMINDILYLMLGTGKDNEEIKTKTRSNCGTDSECFERAFRMCKPVEFMSKEINGLIISVNGLEGNTCVMKATLSNEEGQLYEMTCKIKNYALGIYNPSKDILPYCEGDVHEFIKVMK